MELNQLWLLLLSCIQVIKEYHFKPIVGGSIVYSIAGSYKKYPYITSLQDLATKDDNQHFCGGSLVNQRWILTAAHCMYRKNKATVVAYIGYEDISNLKKKTDAYKIERVEYVGFQPSTYQNDIALLRLQRDYVGTDINSKVVRIPDYGMKPNRQIPCSIIGYGALGHHVGTTSTQLMEASVYVITKKQCRLRLGHVWAPQDSDNTICAVGEDQDACQGDSGGPLLCRYNNEYYVYGIVSHGIACGGKAVPSLYTITVPYVKWIRSIINQ